MNPDVTLLKLLGFEHSKDLSSYLHIREYTRVFNLRGLVGLGTKIKGFCCREYPKGTEFFVVVDGVFSHFKYDEFDILKIAQFIKEIPHAS